MNKEYDTSPEMINFCPPPYTPEEWKKFEEYIAHVKAWENKNKQNKK